MIHKSNNKDQIDGENDFLKNFIENEMYLQNPPMVAEDFISYAKKLGVNTSEEELEFFEKERLLFPIIRLDRPIEESEKIRFRGTDGLDYMRPLEIGLQEGEVEIDRIKVKSYSAYNLFKEDKVGSYCTDLLLIWYREGYLFEPSSREFQNWISFLGEELEGDRQKIVSFYSNFQIWQLAEIKQLTEVTFTHEMSTFYFDERDISVEEGKVYLDIKARVELYNEEETRQLDRPLELNQKVRADIQRLRRNLDLRLKKEATWAKRGVFNRFLKFLLSVQSTYIPYAKSGSGKIQLGIDWKKWNELKHNFNLDAVLKMLDLKTEDVARWYKIFGDEAQRIIGIKRDDWIELLRSISWDKKEKIEGNIRLGLEYLHWAFMLKRILEGHLHKKILDISELSGVAHDDVLKIKPEELSQCKVSKQVLSTEDKDYRYDRHKKQFYLANRFGLDYQPRVTVYVEGKTEEVVFPEMFEDNFGYEPEKIGIEFISIQGINQFFGKGTTIKTPQGYEKKFISNFNHLASYNLNKWQIIPYFIGDDENDINNLLKCGISISFNKKKFPFPKRWQSIWGITNGNKPFQGKDFEMANFNDEEIAAASTDILGRKIKSSEIKTKRDNGEGLKQVNEEIEKHKIDVARKLYRNLMDEYQKTKNDALFERPIFDVFSKIRELAVLNHPPTSRATQLENKNFIEEILQKNQ